MISQLALGITSILDDSALHDLRTMPMFSANAMRPIIDMQLTLGLLLSVTIL